MWLPEDAHRGVGISRDHSSMTALRRRRPEYPSMVVPSFSKDEFYTAATGSTCDLRPLHDPLGFGKRSDITKHAGDMAITAFGRVCSIPGFSSASTTASCDSLRQRYIQQTCQSPYTPEVAETSAQLGSSKRTVEVILRKSVESQVFGFSNVPEVSAHGRSCLRITKVDSSGILAAWNTLHPAKSLGPGDRIIAVNGVSEDLAEMRELLCASSARLLAERYSFEDVAPASVSPHAERLWKDLQKSVAVDVRVARLQHQISKAEGCMSQGTSNLSAKSPRPWQPNPRNDLLEKERRVEELERQLLLWQLSEPKSGKGSLPEWRRARQCDAGIEDGSNDGENVTGRTPSVFATPNCHSATCMSDSPSREDQYFLRQRLQRKVDRLLASEDSLGSRKVSAPVQIETIETQADKDRAQLQRRLDEHCEEMATWKELLQRMEQQMADLAAQRRKGAASSQSEEVLLIPFPSAAVPNRLHGHLCESRPGTYSSQVLSYGDVQATPSSPLISVAELETLRASQVEAEHRQDQLTDVINTKNQVIQELQAKLSQSKEEEWLGQARRSEEEARQQAKLILEMKDWELREQQLAAETEVRQRRSSLARAAERDEDAQELRLLRQRESAVARETLEQQEQLKELQARHSHAQQCAKQAQEDSKKTVRELQEWQLKHTEEMKFLEVRALASQEDASLTHKKAILCEEQVQHLTTELRKQEAMQRKMLKQDAATSNLQTRLEEQLDQLRTQENQVSANAAEEIYGQEEIMLMLETSELQEQQLAAEAEMECGRKAKEAQYWQSEHTQAMHAVGRQRSEADAAMRSKNELEELQAKELAAKEQRIKELEAQLALIALQPAPPADGFEIARDEELTVAVEVGPPDYVTVAPDDELDVRLGDEIAALGTGILRGEILVRTGASKYKLGDKKIFLKVIDGTVHVRDKGNHIALARWLSQIFAETPAGDDEDLMANMTNPWTEHMSSEPTADAQKADAPKVDAQKCGRWNHLVNITSGRRHH